ncbi:hypothetical protein NHX12_006453 [Muraenolepis orangiensis]|uniref:Metalloendopeptidase n=1 Tax=Muraenolepis orangiensis TaxID=630683 RepID=A0A9Q0DUU7_9TELE|nr:hypothetical protein NHX12_006453 [Muraenolepis orangiensis]
MDSISDETCIHFVRARRDSTKDLLSFEPLTGGKVTFMLYGVSTPWAYGDAETTAALTCRFLFLSANSDSDLWTKQKNQNDPVTRARFHDDFLHHSPPRPRTSIQRCILPSYDDTEDTDEQLGATDAIEAANTGLDPCTAMGCTWPKNRNSFVYVPIYISPRYTKAERSVIIRSLVAFHSVSCIRFTWRRRHRDYIYFYPYTGCWSYIGRQGNRQMVSIQQRGCVYTQVIQHEVLHALGFHHEQARSDRDDFVQIMTENIQPGKLNNFDKVDTNNLATPYDYSSIMHYGRFAFSTKRGVLPTIVPTPDATAVIGKATQMSANDIERVNQLYQCSGVTLRLFPENRSAVVHGRPLATALVIARRFPLTTETEVCVPAAEAFPGDIHQM